MLPGPQDYIAVLQHMLKNKSPNMTPAEMRLVMAEYRTYTLTHGTPAERARMRWWWAKQDQLIANG
jgi:hypothetical protein